MRNEGPASSTTSTAMVAIGRVAKAQGRHGEVAVQPLTDFPERFESLERVFVEERDGEASAHRIESSRLHKGRPVLKLAGISGISEAQALAGREIRIPESELLPLPTGSFYHFQLRGLRVLRGGSEVGVVEEILSTGGTDVLVVRETGGGEALVPLCSEFCRRIDPEGGAIEIEVPEGLFGLNEN